MRRFASFREFYPFYLSEHANRTSRRPHFTGSCAALVFVALAIAQRNAWWLLAALVAGYALAWIGHFFFEKNRPATFRPPLYSFAGAWVLRRDSLTGRITFGARAPPAGASRGRSARRPRRSGRSRPSGSTSAAGPGTRPSSRRTPAG